MDSKKALNLDFYTADGKVFHVGNYANVGGQAYICIGYYKESPNVTFRAKIYKERDMASSDIADKLQYLKEKFTEAKLANVVYPQDLLYTNADHSGEIAGFVMREVTGSLTLASAIQDVPEKGMLLWRWTRCELAQVALNVVSTFLEIHKLGILVGDISMYNIMVNSDMKVDFIDVDSYQSSDGDRTWLCPVGRPEYCTPEMLDANVDFSTYERTLDDELHAVCVLIFTILFLGRNPYARSHGFVENHIREHKFIYPDPLTDKNPRPKTSWQHIWYKLPYELRNLFNRAFRNDERIPLDKLYAELLKYKNALDLNRADDELLPTVEAADERSTYVWKDIRQPLNEEDAGYRYLEYIRDTHPSTVQIFLVTQDPLGIYYRREGEQPLRYTMYSLGIVSLLSRIITFDKEKLFSDALKELRGNVREKLDMLSFPSSLDEDLVVVLEKSQLTFGDKEKYTDLFKSNSSFFLKKADHRVKDIKLYDNKGTKDKPIIIPSNDTKTLIQRIIAEEMIKRMNQNGKLQFYCENIFQESLN